MGNGGEASSSTTTSTLSHGVLKKVILVYAYVALWIFLSFTVIVYNKYILDPKMYNWPFPISLTLIHMAFCSTLAFVLVRVLKCVEVNSLPMTRQIYMESVVPIGALYSLSLWFSNSAYIYLSVSFIQMLKAVMPVAVYSIGVLFKKENFKTNVMVNMLSISFGVAIAAYGEARFDIWGVFLQLGAVAFEATRLVMIQILLNSKETSTFHFDYLIFGTNSFCAFALNLAVFLLVDKTSALTMNVAGVVKDWLLIAFSWSVIKDKVTLMNLFGYGVAFMGVAYYNHTKLVALKEAEAQRRAQAADKEAAGRLMDQHNEEN
ncbi:probable sugar phosphate/phosphate translocator At5g25400 isoform X2 [Pistacia vera]|uniref:probable sugar phosphate/phosphate translocator At5g25400 isoform X2 n=1 Tax=Pistacia vera TaxID=55513 RepID=UPI001263D889|nr:probable sugar phosphate/phosphate translocator At5g25400 isoform X2 [Pistacia vera]